VRPGVLAVVAMFGVAAGLGAYTFVYAEGASYLSTDPEACLNCHIMQPQFDAWQKSSHHAVAGCVDCHLPATGLHKWVAKMDNGYRHSKAFTLQDFHEPIRITPGNAAILKDNCLRCHGPLLHDQMAGVTTAVGAPDCVRCHGGVGHGERAGLGGRDRGLERELARAHALGVLLPPAAVDLHTHEEGP
jgi:cytochrome c nitrite reductase small subunit